MSLQRRPSHTGGCLFILFTVVILMVCSAPVFENNKKLVTNSPVERHIIHPIRLNPPAESSYISSETSQLKVEGLKQISTYLDDSSEYDNVNSREKKHVTSHSPRRKLRKLVKRSEEKEDEKSEEKEHEKEENSEDEKNEEKREEKDEDKEDGDVDDWGVKSDGHPVESESNSQEAEKNGISPVKGPYLNISGSEDKQIVDDEMSGKQHNHAHTFRNWEEYLQAQKDVIRKSVSNKPVEARGLQRESFRKPVNRPRPVIHSDDHFRFIDKLFKAKNDKVKAFHSLVLFMKQQGKSFKIPQRPTTQTTVNPGNKHETGMKTTAKPSK